MRSFVIFSVAFIVSSLVGVEGSLELVHVFFRHGSRTPEECDTYPNDPYKLEHFQPMGWGQLTNSGKQRAYRLGKMLRQRYSNFLGDIFTTDIVETISTDFDRTKMSALLVLAGLFPPSSSQKWDDDLSWLPIPYNFEKETQDYFIRRPAHYCPTYINALEEIRQSEVQKGVLREYKNDLDYISEHSGKKMETLLDVFRIYQTLLAEDYMNFTLPEWTKRVWPEPISKLAGIQCAMENWNSLLKRLNGGRSLKKVIEHMNDKIKGNLRPEGRKIYLYSGHENNVLNILAALNLFKPHVPKYSAATIIELHYETQIGKYLVKVYYAREVGEDPQEMPIPGCNTPCTIESFIEAVKEHIPVNYTQECASQQYLGE